MIHYDTVVGQNPTLGFLRVSACFIPPVQCRNSAKVVYLYIYIVFYHWCEDTNADTKSKVMSVLNEALKVAIERNSCFARSSAIARSLGVTVMRCSRESMLNGSQWSTFLNQYNKVQDVVSIQICFWSFRTQIWHAAVYLSFEGTVLHAISQHTYQESSNSFIRSNMWKGLIYSLA